MERVPQAAQIASTAPAKYPAMIPSGTPTRNPRAQREVIGILRRIVELRPGLQIIATTHSPYIVDEFPPEAVVVLTLDDEGHTMARRLSEHPKFDKWKEAMNTGELWAWVGEDWIREQHGE